jgi:hypothetical protein
VKVHPFPIWFLRRNLPLHVECQQFPQTLILENLQKRSQSYSNLQNPRADKPNPIEANTTDQTNPVNDVASFDKAGYKMLRPSGRKGPVRGRLIDEMKFVTKDAIAYSGTGWKNKGVEEEAQFIVTGHHDPDRKAVEQVHLDGKAELTREGKVLFQGQL